MMESLGDLVVRLGLDSDGFQSGIANLNRQMKLIQSEFNAASAKLGGFDNSLEGLRLKSDMLARQMDVQRQKVEALKGAMQDSQQKFERFANAAAEVKQKLDETRAAYERSKSAIGENAEETKRLKAEVEKLETEFYRKKQSMDSAARSIENYQIRVNKAEAELSNFENQLKEVNQQIQKNSSVWNQIGQRMSEVGQRMKDLGERMQSAGQGIAMSFGAVTTAIGGALGFAVKKSMDFEAQMSSVKSVMSPDEVKKFSGTLEELAIQMGAKTKYSALEAAQGIEELVKAGVKVTDIVNGGLEGALNLAAAGELELADAAEIASTALNAFRDDNLSVSDAANILAGAANASATDVGELKFGLSAVSAVAAGVGLSFKDTATTLALFAQNSLKGQDAGTSLKTMLTNLTPKTNEQYDAFQQLGLLTFHTGKALQFLAENGIKPASNSMDDITTALEKYVMQTVGAKKWNEECKKTFRDLTASQGILSSAFYDNNGNLKSMTEIAGILQNALKGLNAEQRQQMLYTMFGSDAIRAANILYKEGAKGVEQMAAAMSKVTAADVAAEKMNNLKGQIEQLKGAIETAAISVRNALLPAISVVVAALQKLVDWFNGLSPTMQSFIAITAAVGAVLTGMVASFGVVLAVVGAAANGIGALTEAFGVISGAIAEAGGMAGVFSTAIAAITGPIGIAVAAIVGLGVAFTALYQKNEAFRNGVQQVWQRIKIVFEETLLTIGSVVKSAMSAVTSFFSSKLQQIRQFWQQNGSQIQKVMSVVMSAIGVVVKTGMALIQAAFTVSWNVIKAATSSVWNTIKSIISGGLNIILGVIKTFVSILTGDWRGAWEGAKQTVKGAIQTIGAMSTMMIDIGRNIISGLIKGLASAAKGLYEKAKEIANNVVSTIKKALDIHSPSRETEKLGKYTTEGFAKGIESKKRDVEKSAKNTAEAAKKAFEEQFKAVQYNFKIGKIDESQYISKLRTILKEYAKTSDQVRKVNLEIKKVQEEQAKKTAEITRKTFEQGKQAIEYQKQIRNVSLEQELQWWNNLAKQFKKGTKERMEAEKEAARVKNEITNRNFENEKQWFEEKKYYGQLSLTQELESLNTVAKRYKKGTEERIYWEREIFRVKKEISDKLKQINDEYVSKIEEANKRLAESEKQLTDEYNRAVEERAKSLYSFTGLFDEFTAKTDVTGAQLLQNLRDQVKGFESWQVAIQSLVARGVDKGLIAELQEMGPKALGEIQALTTLSDSQLQEYVNLWRQKSSLSREEAVKELADLNTQTQAKIKELREATAKEIEGYKAEWTTKIKEITTGTKTEFTSWATSMQTIGNQAIEGLIEGMKAMTGPLQAQAKAIADSVSKTIKSALKIKSPSRVMMDEVGRWIPLGLAEGISRNISAVVSATNLMARAAIPSINGSATSGAVKSIVNNTTNTPITIHLNYNGTGSQQDAYEMVDIIERELGRRAMNRLRFGGMRV